MNLENNIKDVINKKMEDGTIERLIGEQLEKGINKSLENLLGTYGDVTKIIEGKIKEVMVSQLSKFDYSNYVVKLDCVLTEILEKTTLDHKKILENFKELMLDDDIPKQVKVSDIFEKYKKNIAKNINTSDLKIDYDDCEPSYQFVTATMEIEHEEKRSWSTSSFKNAKIILECEEDEDLNLEINISKFMEYPWKLSEKTDTSIDGLRYLDEFKIYILKLYQKGTILEIDEEYLSDDEVEPEGRPEIEYR